MNEQRRLAASAADVLGFWRALGPERWFVKDSAVDAEIAARFGATHEAAAAGRLACWAETPDGALALVIVLDQFPRNMFRGDARAYATDPEARTIAAEAIRRGFDRAFANPEPRLFYLPFMHSKALADQERCLALCAAAGDADGVKHAEIHADIIRRFGRFPHRNEVLGRAATSDEQAFLDSGGFSG